VIHAIFHPRKGTNFPGAVVSSGGDLGFTVALL
jgi:hypothetical protein